MTQCIEDTVLGVDCYSTSQARLNLVNEINNQYKNWTKTYSTLISGAGPAARLYVIAYPQIVGSGSCGDNVWLTANDITFANELISYLDYVIQQAAMRTGAIYVDTQDALSDHELCEASGSSEAVNGLTWARNGQVISQGSYHPNVYGQQLLAQCILTKTSDFTSPTDIPQPDSAIAPPASSDSDSQLTALLTAPSGPVPVVNTEPVVNGTDNFINNVFQKSGNINYTVNGISYGLRPNTSYTLTMHSDPVTVGTFTTDANGNLSISTPVPSALDPGLHEMNITGVGLSGEQLDLVDTAFVNAAPTNLTAISPTSQAPALSWTAVPDATSYNIYRGGTLAGSSTTNSYTDSSATPGTYSYTVTAVFTAVESSDSNAVTVAYDSALPTITNFTANNGTTFSRQSGPYSTGVATQAINSDGSISVSVNNAPGYADAGFYLYKTTLGSLPSFTVNSSRGDFGLNLWFDAANLGDFFQWDSNGNLTGLGGDTYGLSSGSTNASLTVNGNSSFYMMDSGQSYTLSQLIAGDDTTSGINANTPVAVWIGVEVGSGGSTSATISSISGL